jgi:hypothetical protein
VHDIIIGALTLLALAIARKAAGVIGDAIWNNLTEMEKIIYIHYKEKMAGHGHKPKTPVECVQDKCAEATK